jgi:hypothetical protein
MASRLHGRSVMGWAHRRNRKVVGLVLVGLVLAVGFCLFDGDDQEDCHAGFDLCLGMLATVLTVDLVSRLPLAGSAVADHRAPALAFSPRVPAPPPKTPLS